jgi:hypothetical protein
VLPARTAFGVVSDEVGHVLEEFRFSATYRHLEEIEIRPVGGRVLV